MITTALFAFLCLPLGQREGRARGGEMDLRGQTPGAYRLTGEWQYAPDLLAMPGEFPDNAQTINLPDTRRFFYGETAGCATYRLTVYTDSPRASVFIPEIHSAYRLWINGEFVRGAGAVSDREARGVPARENAFVPVRAEGSAVEIVIQASAYGGYRPHLNNVLLFYENGVNAWFYITRSIYMLTMGAVLASAVFYLTLFLTRREIKTHLVFASFCLVSVIKLALETDGAAALSGVFAAGTGRAGENLYTVLFCLHGALFAFFIVYITGAERAARISGRMKNKVNILYFMAAGAYAVCVFLKFFAGFIFMAPVVSDICLILTHLYVFARQYADAAEKERRFDINAEIFNKISHDLRTPLTRISTNIQMAKFIPEESAEYLANTQADVMRMAEIINETFPDGGTV